MENDFYDIFSDDSRKKVKNIKREIVFSILGCIKAYTILISITFLVIWVSFTIFNVPYAFVLGAIGGLLDLVPFLGIVVIFVPVIIYYALAKNYFVSISITIVFIILSIVRQILEPKLVAKNIGINPLETVAAIFIGIQVAGIIGMVFCLGLVAMHEILKKVNIL
jgi:predicted PurR-regulated permease PerM